MKESGRQGAPFRVHLVLGHGTVAEQERRTRAVKWIRTEGNVDREWRLAMGRVTLLEHPLPPSAAGPRTIHPAFSWRTSDHPPLPPLIAPPPN